MSSAIEVLKTMLEIRKKPNLFVSECCRDPFEDRRIAEANALGEAIVALEKQERLKEWLEKEIDAFETEINGFEKKLEMNTWKKEQEIEYVKLRVLELESKVYLSRKVLERVGEQK